MTLKKSQDWKLFLEHPRIILLLLSLSFFLGVWSGSLGYTYETILWCFLVLLFFMLVARFKLHWAVVVILLCVLASAWSYGKNWYDRQEQMVRYFEHYTKDNQSHTIVWQVETLLYQWDFSRTYRHKIDNIDNISTDEKSTPGHLLLEVPKNINMKIGDTVKVVAKIFPVYSGTTLEWFEKYVWKEGVFWKIKATSVQVMEPGTPGMFDHVKNATVETLYTSFPTDVAAIILGTTIGNTDFLFKSLKDDFLGSGMTHILVVSGSNIAFIIVMLVAILRYIPIKRYVQMSMVVIFLLAYGFLVSWDIPVIRATVMGIIAYLSIMHGKKIASGFLLIILWAFLVLLDPFTLLYDVGFGLSFGATLWILMMERFRQKRSEDSWFWKNIWPLISLTIGASLWSLPVIFYHFGTLSIGSFFANILIGPIVGLNLFMSVCYLLGSFILPDTLLFILWYVPYGLSSTIIFIASFFAGAGIWTLPDSIAHILPPILIFGGLCIFIAQERTIILLWVQKAQSLRHLSRGSWGPYPLMTEMPEVSPRIQK